MRRVLWSAQAGQAVLAAMPPEAKRKVRAALESLRRDRGDFKGLDVRMLETGGIPAVYRMRVGVWRVAFVMEGKDICITRVFHRKDGYGWLVDL